jgi:hypothetical protein
MRLKIMTFLIIILASVFTIGINAAQAIILWQFGDQDQSFSEYAAVDGGAFAASHTLSIGSVSVSNPVYLSGSESPGYLFSQNAYPEYSWVTTSSVETLSFEFTLEFDYSQLDLYYGRFGSEIDYIWFDGISISSVDGTAEGQWDLFEIAITGNTGNIGAGHHTLSIAYGGGDADNGHFIDFVRLENGILEENSLPEPVPEPATLVLLGTGLVGLAGGVKHKKRLKK